MMANIFLLIAQQARHRAFFGGGHRFRIFLARIVWRFAGRFFLLLPGVRFRFSGIELCFWGIKLRFPGVKVLFSGVTL